MVDDDYDDEDADYELEEEEEDEDEEGDDEDEVEEEDDDEGFQMVDVDMGSFSEPGRKFLSKVWKEYEPICVDGVVVAAECKRCAKNIRAERKHGTSSLRKHLKRCNERKKALRVAGENLLFFCAANTRRPMDSVHDIILALEGIVVCRVFS